MRRLARAVVYTVLLCTLLAIASFWFYHSSSQVELRLRQVIGSALTVPVGLDACRSDPFGAGLQVAAVRVPAAPPLSSRTLLTIEDLRLEGSRGAAFRRGLRRDRSPPPLELTRLRVGRARLVLEHQRGSSQDGHWNFESLFRAGKSLADYSRAPARILADEMVVLLRRLEPGSRPLEWEVRLESVDVRPTDPHLSSGPDGETPETGILLEGDLAEGEFWAGGQLRIELLADGVVEVGGNIDDFRMLPRHRTLVPPEWRSLCDDLDPVGTVDLNLETIRLSSREDAAIRIRARHYDSGMRLGPEGARLKHLRGVVSITETGVRFGQFAELEPLETELWGVGVRLDGLLSTSQQRLVVHLPETNLQDVELSAVRPPPGVSSAPLNLAGLKDSLGVAGTIRGEVTGDLFPESPDKWKGSLTFRDLTLQRWPWIYGGSGRIDVTVNEGTRGALLDFERLEFSRIGELSGEVDCSWGPSGVRLASSGLQVAEKDVVRGEGPRGAHAEDEEPGTIFGAVAWSWEKGLTELEIRWLGLELDTELFSAQDFGGQVQLSGDEVGGPVECGTIDIPTAPFGAEGEKWTFDRGKGRLLLEDGRIWIPAMKLLGKDWSLRFQGELHVAGDLNFVAVLAPASIYEFRVDELDGKGPEDWKEKAGGDFTAYRITGSMAHPRIRPMGPLDPAVIR